VPPSPSQVLRPWYPSPLGGYSPLIRRLCYRLGIRGAANEGLLWAPQGYGLRPLTFLAAIIASRSAAFGGLDRLAVDDPGRGAAVATSGFPLQPQFKNWSARISPGPAHRRNSLAPWWTTETPSIAHATGSRSSDIQQQVGFPRTPKRSTAGHIRCSRAPTRAVFGAAFEVAPALQEADNPYSR